MFKCMYKKYTSTIAQRNMLSIWQKDHYRSQLQQDKSNIILTLFLELCGGCGQHFQQLTGRSAAHRTPGLLVVEVRNSSTILSTFRPEISKQVITYSSDHHTHIK